MPNPTVIDPPPPPFLADIRKTAIRRLDPDRLLRDALAATRADVMHRAIVAFYGLERAYAAAERQQQRIARAKRQLARIFERERQGVRSVPRRARGTVFDDIHFYVICWTRFAKLGRYLRDTTRFRRLGLVLKRYKRDLDAMIEARDHLEHFEERLGDGPRGRQSLRQPGDLFNVPGNQMSFGGTLYDVGPNSRELLRMACPRSQYQGL